MGLHNDECVMVVDEHLLLGLIVNLERKCQK